MAGMVKDTQECNSGDEYFAGDQLLSFGVKACAINTKRC